MDPPSDKAIINAFNFGHYDAIKLYVKEGGNVNATLNGENLLTMSIRRSVTDIEWIRWLLDQKVKYKGLFCGEPLTHTAYRNRDMKIFQELVNRGIDINSVNSQGKTVMNIFRKDDLKYVKIIIDLGIDINNTNIYALFNGERGYPDPDWQCMKYYIEHGLRVSEENFRLIGNYPDNFIILKRILRRHRCRQAIVNQILCMKQLTICKDICGLISKYIWASNNLIIPYNS